MTEVFYEDNKPQQNQPNMASAGPEKLVWSSRPSQVENWDKFVMYLIIPALIIPLTLGYNSLEVDFEHKETIFKVLKIFLWIVPFILIVFKYLETHCHFYEITTQRMVHSYGILNRQHEELELYRVKDITTEQPIQLRVMGQGNIILSTSDVTNPLMLIRAIKDPIKLQMLIRKHVEIMRGIKGVREID